MERIDGALLISHEYATRALVELMQIGKTPSGANPIRVAGIFAVMPSMT
jgi:hypothetical protein